MQTVNHSFPRAFRYSIVAAILCSSLSVLWVLFKSYLPIFEQTGDALILPLGAFLSPIIALSGRVPQNRPSGSSRLRFAQRWVPVVYVIITISECIGTVLPIYRSVVLNDSSSPLFWSVGFDMTAYLFCIISFVLQPMDPVPGPEQLRRFLDSMLTLGSLILLNWYFIIGPVLLQLSEDLPSKLVTIAYPVWSLIFIYGFLYMTSRTSDPSVRTAIILFACAVLMISLSGDLYAYLGLQNKYSLGGPLDVAIQAGFLLFALATQALRLTPRLDQSEEASAQVNRPLISSTWSTLVPYFLLPLVASLLISIWRNGRGEGLLELGVYCGGGILLLLLFLRQIVVLREITSSAQRADRLNQALAQANIHLEALATIDPLTNLPNHRAVMDQLSKEFDRARRSDCPFSLLFFDADHFKRINDTYGHAAGDEVLRQIGKRTGSVLRSEDTLGRIGGEEFVILLPEADGEEASMVAERVRQAVASEPVVIPEGEASIVMTVSVGLSTYPSDGNVEQELLSQADEAMYVAKRMGRNQVRSAEEARQIHADVELMSLLQEEGQREEAQREGFTAESLRETYTAQSAYALLFLLERRDEGMNAHAVSDLAISIAQAMGLEAVNVSKVGLTALLHDIGKVAISDRLLQKVSPLSSHENELLREHAELGAQILEANPFLRDLTPGVRHHHECWDGSGYPDQLAGECIPLVARIIAVAEFYDTLLRTYYYQAKNPPEEARVEMQGRAGTQFDPAIVRNLLVVLDRQLETQQLIQAIGSG